MNSFLLPKVAVSLVVSASSYLTLWTNFTFIQETRCPTCSDNIIEELSLETDESPTSHPPLQTEPDHNEAHRQTHARHLQFIQNINLPHGRWPHNTVGRERQNSTPHAHQQQVTFRAHPGQPFAFHG